MNEPIFLTLKEVLEIHAFQIAEFGGSDEVLDLDLLESAIAQPSQRFDGKFLHPDIASMAAAYLFHIVTNHPFADGNKRTGTHAALVFLGMNGIDLGALPASAEKLVLSVATGDGTKEQVADFFRQLISKFARPSRSRPAKKRRKRKR